MPAALSVVTVAQRPDLVEVVAGWLWEAFGRASGEMPGVTRAAVAAGVTAAFMPQVFVLLADGVPLGTASLTADDLPERPDLTPWLASVCLAPSARGQGHAGRLVTAVEAAAREAAVSRLWLYTRDAERLYARLGWVRDGVVQHRLGGATLPVMLMHRDLPR